jgi:hypothetical protein
LAARLSKAEFEEVQRVVPELADAIKALIRGYLPPRLRNEPFSISIEVTRDKEPRGRAAKKTPAADVADSKGGFSK